MRKTVLVIFSCFLSLLFVPKTYGQGQDKLLGLLKEELAQQMKELKGEEFPPYHMNYRVIDVTSSRGIGFFRGADEQSAISFPDVSSADSVRG